MDVEVGYIPKHYGSNKPYAGGFFPFAIDGTANYVFDINIYLPECDENWLPLWMENLLAFPIYICAEIPSYWKKEYENSCKEFNISYQSLSDKHHFSVIVTEVQDVMQFREIFLYFITIGTGNDLVLWSTNIDVFSIENREWKHGLISETVVVKMEADLSVFWIGYDGDNIAVISNNQKFSTNGKICKAFPEFINSTQCKFW